MPNRREQNPVKFRSKNKIPKSFVRDHKAFVKAYKKDMQWNPREQNPRPKVQDVGF